MNDDPRNAWAKPVIRFMWFWILLLVVGVLIVSSGCGWEEPDFTTVHGIRVFDETDTQQLVMRKAEIEQTTQVLLDVLIRGKRELHNLTLRVQSEPIDWTADGREIDGRYYWLERTLRVRDSDSSYCFATTAFIHELVHHYQHVWDNERDGRHRDPKWWGDYGVEQRAKHFAYRRVCRFE